MMWTVKNNTPDVQEPSGEQEEKLVNDAPLVKSINKVWDSNQQDDKSEADIIVESNNAAEQDDVTNNADNFDLTQGISVHEIDSSEIEVINLDAEQEIALTVENNEHLPEIAESTSAHLLESWDTEATHDELQLNNNQQGEAMNDLMQKLLDKLGNGLSLNLSKTDKGTDEISVTYAENTYHPKTAEQAENVINALKQRAEADKILSEAMIAGN